MTVGLLVDGFVILLLIMFAFQVLLLDRRLARMRGSMHGLKDLIGTFTEKVDQSERLLSDMKAASREIDGTLAARFAEGERLHDDMRVILSACDTAGSRLEKGLGRAHGILRRDAEAGPAPDGAAATEEEAAPMPERPVGPVATPDRAKAGPFPAWASMLKADGAAATSARPAIDELLGQMRAAKGEAP